jgi:hypothetical protein
MKVLFPALRLTDVERRILEVLRSVGVEWQTRKQIASLLGRKSLDAYYVSRLNKLEHWGFIQTRKIKQQGVGHFEYRATDKNEN